MGLRTRRSEGSSFRGTENEVGKGGGGGGRCPNPRRSTTLARLSRALPVRHPQQRNLPELHPQPRVRGPRRPAPRAVRPGTGGPRPGGCAGAPAAGPPLLQERVGRRRHLPPELRPLTGAQRDGGVHVQNAHPRPHPVRRGCDRVSICRLIFKGGSAGVSQRQHVSQRLCAYGEGKARGSAALCVTRAGVRRLAAGRRTAGPPPAVSSCSLSSRDRPDRSKSRAVQHNSVIGVHCFWRRSRLRQASVEACKCSRSTHRRRRRLLRVRVCLHDREGPEPRLRSEHEARGARLQLHLGLRPQERPSQQAVHSATARLSFVDTKAWFCRLTPRWREPPNHFSGYLNATLAG